jgi:hypothetical protein
MIEQKYEVTSPFEDIFSFIGKPMLAVKPRIREILESDLDAIGDLLTRGFVYRKREYWLRGLRRQATRSLPSGVPRYGYLLENQGVPVGCLLQVYSTRIVDGEAVLFCNLSSWYVDPAYRNFAAMFASMSQKRRDVTYFNVTPAAATWPVIEAQGFLPYCRGLHFSAPALSPGGRGMTIEAVAPDTLVVKGLPGEDLELLKRHAEYGSLSLVCHIGGSVLPFVFFPLRKRRGVIPVPAMQLGYCRSIEDYVRCAGAIGRYLLRRGKPIIIADANGPIAALPGIYTEVRGRKYFKGPHQPRLGDLADTELAIYGL